MSQPSPAAVSVLKPRNPVERVLVWGGIVLLLGVAVVEYRAKQGYDATIRNLQDVTNGTRDVMMEEARKLIVDYSREEGPTPNQEGFQTYKYNWFSLFRGGVYQLTLVVSSDGTTLRTFDGPGFAEDPAALAAKAAAHENAPLSEPPVIGARPPENPQPIDETGSSDQPIQRPTEAQGDSPASP